MKILFDHSSPFILAHGGVQIQIEQTKAALQLEGIEVEFLRWWDDVQAGSLIHYFGVPPLQYLDLAHQKKLPVVMTNTFSATCNRSDRKLWAQGLAVKTLLGLPGWGTVKRQLTWTAYGSADCNIVGLEAERRVLRLVYGIPEDKIRVVPLALSDVFLNVQRPADKEDYLITTGAINAVKRSVDLARMAHAARVPILFVGKPYHTQDQYWQTFQSLIDNCFVRYTPHVADVTVMIDLLRKARGFVMYSHYENWCLSAHEAAGCGLPLLLPRKRWAVERFNGDVTFFPEGTFRDSVAALSAFYERCPLLVAPRIPTRSWRDVASDLARIYREFTTPRRETWVRSRGGADIPV